MPIAKLLVCICILSCPITLSLSKSNRTTQQWLDKIRTGGDSDQPKVRCKGWGEAAQSAVLRQLRLWLVATLPVLILRGPTLIFVPDTKLTGVF